jgi:hypothetical protein
MLFTVKGKGNLISKIFFWRGFEIWSPYFSAEILRGSPSSSEVQLSLSTFPVKQIILKWGSRVDIPQAAGRVPGRMHVEMFVYKQVTSASS